MRRTLLTLVASAAALAGALPARAATVRDVAQLRGVSEHKVFGVGLVVGLRGTGDRGRETQKRIAALLSRMNLTVSPADLPTKNVALVFVTARIKSDAPKGTRLDVTVSSMGDASSLVGGELLPTPLHTDDAGDVYARAQGAVAAGTGTGAHPTAGSIAGGASVEQEIPSLALERSAENGKGERVWYLDLVLAAEQGGPDMANDIAAAINTGMRAPADAPLARALSATEVRVEVPRAQEGDRVAFAREVLRMPVSVEPPARVVINERTGVVVATGSVRISPADITVGQRRIVVGRDATLAQLKEAVGSMDRLRDYAGASGELIEVIKELAKAGALQAELVSR